MRLTGKLSTVATILASLIITVAAGLPAKRQYLLIALADHRSQSKSRKPDRQPAAGFLLTAVPQKDVIRFAEPLKLGLTIMNVSKRIKFIRETSATEEYRLTVLDEREKPVPLTKYGETELQPRLDHLAKALRAMKPGEESHNIIKVNKLYDMPPGTYSIRARRIIYDQDAKQTGSVESNTVKVRVTN